MADLVVTYLDSRDGVQNEVRADSVSFAGDMAYAYRGGEVVARVRIDRLHDIESAAGGLL